MAYIGLLRGPINNRISYEIDNKLNETQYSISAKIGLWFNAIRAR